MVPWEKIGSAQLAGGGVLSLTRRGDEFALRLGGAELMNSRAHHSEDQLAVLACAGLGGGARVLVGGLGMGFTARAALDAVPADARVEIAELVPEVVAWNRGPLAPLAGAPLDDARITLFAGDVAARMAPGAAWDAILLDVDNGPGAFTAPGNAALYGDAGLARAREALRPGGGTLAVWSVADDRAFTHRLRAARFDVRTERVTARPTGGAVHTLWLARRS